MTTKNNVKYIVTGDCNDGDYVTENFNATKYCKDNKISLEDLDKKIRDFLSMLKENKHGHN